jgi:hypothetical protein
MATAPQTTAPDPTAAPPDVRYYVGLDLGQVSDYTAISVLKQSRPPLARPDDDYQPASYTIAHLDRFRGVPYPEVVRRVKELLGRPELHPVKPERVRVSGNYRLVDEPARPVDMFVNAKMPGELVPLTITSGSGSRRDSYAVGVLGWWVAKLELVGCVQACLQGGRLKCVPALSLAPVLTRELQDFQVRITASANETFSARENAHDDLLLATATALWAAERPIQRYFLYSLYDRAW